MTVGQWWAPDLSQPKILTGAPYGLSYDRVDAGSRWTYGSTTTRSVLFLTSDYKVNHFR